MVMERNRNGGNGHNDERRSLLQAIHMPNMMQELVKPGDNIKELLMRTNLTDVNEARDLALSITYCVEFNLQEDLETLLFMLAARTSINEMARKELLMGLTGILSPSVWGAKGKTQSKRDKNPDNMNRADSR